MLTVSTLVHAPLSVVWEKWTTPTDIVVWCTGHPDWHTPRAENDLRVGGRFVTRMEAKDGSMGFDFGGEYTEVETLSRIAYLMDDGRKCIVSFVQEESGVTVREDFDAEKENSEELQTTGWQGILENFKRHTEESLGV